MHTFLVIRSLGLVPHGHPSEQILWLAYWKRLHIAVNLAKKMVKLLDIIARLVGYDCWMLNKWHTCSFYIACSVSWYPPKTKLSICLSKFLQFQTAFLVLTFYQNWNIKQASWRWRHYTKHVWAYQRIEKKKTMLQISYKVYLLLKWWKSKSTVNPLEWFSTHIYVIFTILNFEWKTFGNPRCSEFVQILPIW